MWAIFASNLPSRVQVLFTSSRSGTWPLTSASRAGSERMQSLLLRKGMRDSAAALARGDRAGLGGEPVERRVVKNDRHVVGGALQVDLDGKARAHGGPDRGGAVLDDALGRIVQAAMGDRPLQPIEFGHVRRSATRA